ncbi:AAA family ATPase [Candidatus Manganitrophus noduliformans]|uniref:AAA family ATPase n=1 Tax=Candidatus Manganitrophus noduliformans TaxID=2606439 RepID=A0A7X6DNK5_9BACT|nr:AAA family ATPase [Candidatus Manganitrophus noduliformans]NKE70203.1 AAA family ATPase [Candidatus Manganitrophus noduliformans]
MTTSLIEQLRAARRVSVPLAAIITADPAETISAIQKSAADSPLVGWDIIRGMLGINEKGIDAVNAAVSGGASEGGLLGAEALTNNPIDALTRAEKLPEGTILFFHMAHRLLQGEGVSQAIWNLRDQFKRDNRMLVLLAPELTLPAELSQDVLLLEEPLPSAEDLARIIREVHAAADVPEPDPKTLERAVNAIRGLAAFPAEQVAAMSLTKKGVRISDLWDRKRQMIRQTPGLSVWDGPERFSNIGGVTYVKEFLTRILFGNAAPRAIVFIDEIEKHLGGVAGDTSGVSQAMLGTLLTYMSDRQTTGLIFIGPGGTAKSVVAKAAGREADIPTITFDMSGMKTAYVGSSEENMRRALRVVTAVSDNAVLFIATCNSIGALPPELRRRFSLGTFFFDLPSAEERKKIWEIYLKAYNLDPQPLPNDKG